MTAPSDRAPHPLVVVAATGAAAELVGILADPHPGFDRHRLTALVPAGDADLDLLGSIAARCAVALLGSLGEAAPGQRVAFAGGRLALDQGIRAAMAAGRHRPATLVHAAATIGPWVDLADGVVVAPGARLTGNVTVGTCSTLHTGAIASHDDVLGNHVTLSPGVTLCGGVTVGDRATVFAGATVMPGVAVGADATVGAGALVHRDVAPGSTVAGVPARPLG